MPAKNFTYEAIWAGVGLFVVLCVRWYFENRAAPKTAARMKS